MDVPPEDLRIDVFRAIDPSDGKGGASTVTVTHIPTGTSVTVSESNDARTNRDQAMQELRRLLDE